MRSDTDRMEARSDVRVGRRLLCLVLAGRSARGLRQRACAHTCSIPRASVV